MSGRSFWASMANLSSVLNWWPINTWAHVICSFGTVALCTPITAATAALDRFVVYDACWNKCHPSLRLYLFPFVEAFEMVSTTPVEVRFGLAVNESKRPSLDFRLTALTMSLIPSVSSSFSWLVRCPLRCYGLPVKACTVTHHAICCKLNKVTMLPINTFTVDGMPNA